LQLDHLTPGTAVRGLLPDATVTVVSVQWHGVEARGVTSSSTLRAAVHGAWYVVSTKLQTE
jgi:hypothetical protein